jgi:hypothetical protein
LRGIGETKGMYSVQWNLSLDNGKILSDGFSAKNYGEVPDGTYVIEYIFDGQTISKRIDIARGRRLSDRPSFKP